MCQKTLFDSKDGKESCFDPGTMDVLNDIFEIKRRKGTWGSDDPRVKHRRKNR